MKLRNTTDIPNELVKEIIRFVRPPGISNFDVMLKNSERGRYAGRAYTQGSGYHNSAAPFVVLRVARETTPRWERIVDGKKHVMSERAFFGDEEWTRVNRPTYPIVMRPYQRGQLRGRRYHVANRVECLVWLAAHELRHLWQAKNQTRRGKAFGARGIFSEIDTESYAIRKLREWREQARSLVAKSPLPAVVDPAAAEEKRRAANRERLCRKIEAAEQSLKRWQTKAKRANTAIKKLTRQLKRMNAQK